RGPPCQVREHARCATRPGRACLYTQALSPSRGNPVAASARARHGTPGTGGGHGCLAAAGPTGWDKRQEPCKRPSRREQSMTHPDIRAALGRERQNTLLADAEAARTARQARLYRRQAATLARRGSAPQCRASIGTEVVLRDGSAVMIRKAHSE